MRNVTNEVYIAGGRRRHRTAGSSGVDAFTVIRALWGISVKRF